MTPKPKRNTNGNGNTSATRSRRGGATLRIREECERFFCETMKAVFHGERNAAHHVSGLTGVYHHQPSNRSRHHQEDAEESDTGSSVTSSIDSGYFGSYTGDSSHRRSDVQHQQQQQQLTPPYDARDEILCGNGSCESNNPVEVTAWMEIWDYQGGASFLAFVAEDIASGEKSLFTFFDAGIVGRDLKKALVALIELTETPLGCSRLVICVDRTNESEELAALTKGLQWAGFELETLDQWAGIRDVTSSKWLFMGMEV